MTGLKYKYYHNIIKSIESRGKIESSVTNVLLFTLIFLTFIHYINIRSRLENPTLLTGTTSTDTFYAGAAFVLSLLTVFTFNLPSLLQPKAELNKHLAEYNIKLAEEEIKHIEESINLFYIPLKNILTTYDTNTTSRVKIRKLNEIYGRRYLAEPRVQAVFERYMQSNNGFNQESRKLLDLANRDIELLHNRLIERNKKLNEE